MWITLAINYDFTPILLELPAVFEGIRRNLRKKSRKIINKIRKPEYILLQPLFLKKG